jgi:hypothetical protein
LELGALKPTISLICPVSASGQKQTFRAVQLGMSALAKADIEASLREIMFSTNAVEIDTRSPLRIIFQEIT